MTRRCLCAVLVGLLVCLATLACIPSAHPAPTTPSADLNDLAQLQVQALAPMAGYSRDQFGPAWEDVDHNHCDTRNDVLQRDLSAIVLEVRSACVVETGTLADPYTGKTIAFVRGVGTSDAVQIDHVVALGDAWQTGAAGWSADQRLQFANDPLELLAVDGPANESKGDRDAASWLPPNAAFRCAYAERQVAVKLKYALWVTAAEHAALQHVLEGCAATSTPVATAAP